MNALSMGLDHAASAAYWFGGHWAGAGWGWWWGPLFLVFWLGVIGLFVWLFTRYSPPRGRASSDRAREILAERFARGEISVEEYRERLSQIR